MCPLMIAYGGAMVVGFGVGDCVGVGDGADVGLFVTLSQAGTARRAIRRDSKTVAVKNRFLLSIYKFKCIHSAPDDFNEQT